MTVGGRVWSAGQHVATAAPEHCLIFPSAPARSTPSRLKATTSSGRNSVWQGRVSTVVDRHGHPRAWLPLPIRIAYLEQVGGSSQLHATWARAAVAGDCPVWLPRSRPPDAKAHSRSPSSRANGRITVVTPTTGSPQTLPRACFVRHVKPITYSPTGGLLAIADTPTARDHRYHRDWPNTMPHPRRGGTITRMAWWSPVGARRGEHASDRDRPMGRPHNHHPPTRRIDHRARPRAKKTPTDRRN